MERYFAYWRRPREQYYCQPPSLSGPLAFFILLLFGTLTAGAATEADRAGFARALEPIRASMKAWDCGKADEALEKLHFESPELTERLATCRAEVALLAALKAKMIATITEAKPRLRKGTILIPGLNGDLVRADENGIVADVPGKGEELHPWGKLSWRTLQRLLRRCVDRRSADDLLASALVALMHNDVTGAEARFTAALARGAKVERHRVPLAEAALAKALALIDGRRFDEAGTALDAVERKYAGTKWLTGRATDIAAARQRMKGGVAEAGAEALYAQAARLFQEEDLVSLKALVDKLASDFPDTRVVTDDAREPSVADMAKAVAALGRILVVRQDGTGDFRMIQPAIEQAPPKSIILIDDAGIYDECPRIPKGKNGLTLMGKRGAWPVITSRKFLLREVADLIRSDSADLTLRGLALAHSAYENVGGMFGIVVVKRWPVRLRSCILYMAWHGSSIVQFRDSTTEQPFLCDLDHCVVATKGSRSYIGLTTRKPGAGGSVTVANSIWVRGKLGFFGMPMWTAADSYGIRNCVFPGLQMCCKTEIINCTILGYVELRGKPNVLRDCIMKQVKAHTPSVAIEHCNAYGATPYTEFARPGKGCIAAPPGLANPRMFDCRLVSDSPCRKAASDGGDMGCRYTPAMLEILRKAYELRDKGLIEF